MIILSSDRLHLIPLDAEDFRMLIDDLGGLEDKVGLQHSGTTFEEGVLEAFRGQLNEVIGNDSSYMWHTIWLMVLKSEKKYIGSLMIKGYPDENGEVILGYGTELEYQGKGYMTEALRRLNKWIFENSNVKAILCDTDKNNVPSHRVLEKNGFEKFDEDAEFYWWKLPRTE